MTQQERYRLSVYTPVKVLREREDARIELVQCTLDGKTYVKKTYPDDKRQVYDILSRIDTPHIPKIKDVFFEADTIVIEQYIPGRTLAARIEEGQAFSSAQIRKITDGLLRAITALHENKLIHRDIKPDNIILTPQGEAVLIDHHISRVYDADRSEDTQHLGTIGYAAPEQFGFSQSDERTDLYALGVTMNKILTKRNSPAYLRRVMRRCEEFDPQRRFPSVQKLAAAIKKQKKGRRVLLSLLGCALAVGLGVLAYCAGGKQNVQYSPLVCEPDVGRLISVYNTAQEVPCLQLPEDGTYQVKTALADHLPETLVQVERTGDVFDLTVDGEHLLTFGGDDSVFTSMTASGQIYGEVIFYDLDADGIREIIPAVIHGHMTPWGDGTVGVTRNYSLAWCICYEEDGFFLAEGRIFAKLDPLQIYDTTPQYIWGDFPMGYRLTDGVLVAVE